MAQPAEQPSTVENEPDDTTADKRPRLVVTVSESTTGARIEQATVTLVAGAGSHADGAAYWRPGLH